MSGGKISPRQKMISLMYLVLMALLALNVSKDILDAFVVINTSLEGTVVNYNEKNESLYADFDAAKQYDPVKVKSLWEKAQKAKTLTKELVEYLKKTQVQLLQETEGVSKEQADTLQLRHVKSKDNYDVPTNIMIGQTEDGSNGLARNIKDQINIYKTEMLSLFNKKKQKELKIDLKTDDLITSSGKENWEIANFYHTPLAAAITILSKLKIDVKKVEYDVVNELLRKAGKKQFNFDTIMTKVMPNSNYVLLGEKYQADVFLAAFSTTQNSEILIGKYDSIKKNIVNVTDTVTVKNGLGQYEVNTNKEGVFSYEGVLRIKKAGGAIENYPFKSDYIVAKPSLVVSPDKMNVFYIGPNNPVSISVPGIAAENIKATITGNGNKITKTANGKYNVKLRPGSPRNIDVAVSAIMTNREPRSMGKMTFVVKPLPQARAYFKNQTGDFSLRKNEVCNFPVVIAKYGKEFVFTGLPLSVVSCEVEVYRNNSRIFYEKIYSKFLTVGIKNFFCQKLRSRDKIYFSKIWVKDVTNQTQKLGGIQVLIK